jgi:hypothetical protein
VAIVLGVRESRIQGEGPHRERRRVANMLNAKAWASLPMSAESKSQKSSHGVAVCDESRMHGGNGGDGKTQVKLCVLSLPTVRTASAVRSTTCGRLYLTQVATYRQLRL